MAEHAAVIGIGQTNGNGCNCSALCFGKLKGTG